MGNDIVKGCLRISKYLSLPLIIVKKSRELANLLPIWVNSTKKKRRTESKV
jgi:hypothetical protein